MSVKELKSVCRWFAPCWTGLVGSFLSFPKTMVDVQKAMHLIEEYDNLRQKMSADTAESAQTV